LDKQIVYGPALQLFRHERILREANIELANAESEKEGGRAGQVCAVSSQMRTSSKQNAGTERKFATKKELQILERRHVII
jgi:hypothetical protein